MAFPTPCPIDIVKLSTPDSVRQYLNDQLNLQTPTTIEPVTVGKNNFTYRLTYRKLNAYGRPENSEDWETSTAFFKFSGMFANEDPSKPFFEACALDKLGPLLIRGTDHPIRIPWIYHSDRDARAILMEDVAPLACASSNGKASLFTSLQEMCQDPIGSNALELIEEIGTWLGRFLIRLHHDISHLHSSSDDLRRLFGKNTASKDIDVQRCFRDVLQKLQEFAVVLESAEATQLQIIIDDMVSHYFETPQSIIMGDFWSGNILLKLTSSNEDITLEKITIIGWEFTTCAPAYVDLAHFLSEIWLQDRFFPQPPDVPNINRQLAIATFKSYISLGGEIDWRRLMCCVGGHVCCYLDYGKWDSNVGLKRTVAEEGVRMMLMADAEDWKAMSTTSPFIRALFEAVGIRSL